MPAERPTGRPPPGGEPPRTAPTDGHFRRRQLVAIGIIALFLALCALLIRACVGDGSGEAGSDGAGQVVSEATPPPPTALELNKQNATKQEAAIQEVLDYTPFLKQGRPGARNVALTFDDGPGAQTAEVLKILRRFDAPSTFFLNGYVMDGRENIVKRIIREGHAIGNHGQDHAHMGQLSEPDQAAQLDQLSERLEADEVPAPHIFRPPYGSFNATTLELLEERDMLMVLWSIDTTDYTQPGAEVIASRTLEEVQPGSVVLMHDGGGDRSQTIEALPDILRGLRERNLTPVTVPELVRTNPPPRDQRLQSAVEVPPPGVASVR